MIEQKLQQTDWGRIADKMNQNGVAIIPGLLSEHQCEMLKAAYSQSDAYRKTVVMERHGYGQGEYKYFNYPLPELIQQIRASIYPQLAPIANGWFRVLGMDHQFPIDHEELLRQCRESGQEKATVLILKYDKGGFNNLHQDLYGDVYFPLQTVLFLSEPERDFTGGEFVLVQEATDAQSKAIVLKPKKGDLLIFATNFRPEQGPEGYYRVNIKHGVSEVRSGELYTLGIIFHDARS